MSMGFGTAVDTLLGHRPGPTDAPLRRPAPRWIPGMEEESETSTSDRAEETAVPGPTAKARG
jgi:hypothetical protein